MTQRSADAGGHGGPQRPGRDAAADDWPDDLWPGEDAPGGSAGASPPPGQPHGTRPGWHTRPGWRPRPGVLAGVALAAAVAGILITIAVHDAAGPAPAAAAPPASQPSFLPGGQGPGGGFPGGAGRMFLTGTVTAVSRSSITIGGAGPSVTGAVTSATRVSGKVTSISGVRPGDRVSAQFTQSGGRTTAVAIRDPAQAPGGGTLP